MSMDKRNGRSASWSASDSRVNARVATADRIPGCFIAARTFS
jgi:hypothetical protein